MCHTIATCNCTLLLFFFNKRLQWIHKMYQEEKCEVSLIRIICIQSFDGLIVKMVEFDFLNGDFEYSQRVDKLQISSLFLQKLGWLSVENQCSRVILLHFTLFYYTCYMHSTVTDLQQNANKWPNWKLKFLSGTANILHIRSFKKEHCEKSSLIFRIHSLHTMKWPDYQSWSDVWTVVAAFYLP